MLESVDCPYRKPAQTNLLATMTTNLAFIHRDNLMRRTFCIIGGLVLALCMSVSAFAQTSSWLQNMEAASSMYDSRGYLKDASRTVDGNVSVSHSNGNVQYRYPISQYSVNQVPISFSLSYNQNASYTSFRRYNGVSAGWESMKQNRPAWIFGLNGFAIQALHTVGRNVLRPQLRKTPGGNERIVSQFSDDDLVWMLDGYDYCNRMYELDPALSEGKFMDVIKLLREDGSVLELVHIEKTTTEPTTCESTDPCVEGADWKTRMITGTYVTTDANSSAYAIVTLHPELMSFPYEETVKAHCIREVRSIGDQIPPEFIPRRVEYFPGDGSSIVFREYMTPYGLEPVVGKKNVARSTNSNYNIDDVIYSGWSDAAPTIFYLEAVKWNNIDLVRIDYAAHDGVELEHGENQQGRAQVIGFDGHNFKWGGRSLTVEAIEKTFEFRFDECLYSGEVDPAIRSSKIGISANPDAGWDATSEYNSWTGLITEIIDPAFRRTLFSYSPYTRIRHQAQFPLPVSANSAECASNPTTDLSQHLTENHSDLRIDVAQLNTVEDPLARYELSYLLVTESALDIANQWLRGIYQFNGPSSAGYVLGPPPAPSVVPPLYDKTAMSVAYQLEKWDRSGTSQLDGGSASKKLWSELYNRSPACSTQNEPCQSSVTITRTTTVEGDAPQVVSTVEKFARYSRGCEYFCAPVDRLPGTYSGMKIVNTAKISSEVTAVGIAEKTVTMYPTTTNGLPVWSKNYLMPNSIEHYTVAPGPGGGLVDLPRSRTEYNYTFEPTCIIPYENVCDSRACEFKNSFGSPVLTRESKTLVMNDAAWQLLTSVRDTFLNLQPEDVETRNYNTWMRYLSIVKFYKKWADEQWTKEEAERQWNEANLSASWNIYGDPTTTADDFVVAYEPVPIVVGLLQSSATRDLTSMGRIESYVVHTYDVEPTIPGPYVTRSSTYGKQLSTKSYGRDLLRGTTTTQTYVQSTHARGVRGLVSQTANELGASSDYYYFGLGPIGSSTITNHAFVNASKITNANLSSYEPMASPKLELVNVELLSLAAKLFEKPTTSRVNVRKPSVGGTTTTSLLSASSYTHFGLSNMTIDQNGYLSTFDYDPIGRLEVAWLPHDYPSANTTDSLAPYDIVETKRSYEIFVDYNGVSESEWLTYHCNDYCSQTPYTTPTSAPLNSTDTHIGYGVGRITNPTATCPCETPATPLTQNMKNGEQAQNIVPAPYAFTFDYEQSYTMTFSGSTEFVPAEHNTITSARLKFSIGQTKNLTGCFPLYITVKVGGTVLNLVPYTWMVNCPLIPPTVPGSSQTSALSSSNPYVFDIEINLDSKAADLASSTAPGNGSPRAFTVEVTSDPEIEGAVWFSRVQLDLVGTFHNSARKRNDFTLGLKHDDYLRHDVSTLAKVDDRSQAYDVSRYPSASPLLASLHSRHAKSLVTLTTDDLVRSEVRNFGPDVMGLLGASINGLSSSTRSTLYTGAGVANSVTSERSYVTSMTFDALNRPTQSQGQTLSLGWVDIAAVTPANSTNAGPETQVSYVVGTPLQLGIPAAKVASFNMYCRREVTRVLRDGNGAYDQVATFYDARGNKRLVVSAYSEAEFVADIANQLAVINQARNLATWYDYDAFNRVVTVTNPKEQVITYTYDDFGNVASTTQTDNGLTTFAYDRLGNLRFSQTAEQAAARTITYKQYDDLGRPTVIGEAAIATTPEPPEQPGYNSLRLTTTQSSDYLHSFGQQLLSVNTTLMQAPARPVNSIYRTLLNPVAPLGGPQFLLQNIVPCPPLIAAGTSDLYNPNFPAQLGNVLVHRSAQWTRPALVAPELEFENAALYPEFVLQAIWYDEMPPLVGPVWANSPPAAVWNAMAPRGEVRNLKGRPSIVAYRTHGGQPFHYIVRSYDERGRVEAQLRLTENVGFDAVYYRYNSMNKIISMHVVDATGQHATFYGYDENGRVSKVWTNKSNAGFNLTMTPTMPATMLELPAQPDMVIGYDEADAVVSVTYPEPDVQTAYVYNAAGTRLRSTTTSPIGAIFDQRLSYSQSGLIYQQWFKTGDSKNLDVYNYDGANRLQFWQRNQMLGDPETSREYAYDRIGNRLISETYAALPPDESVYTYGLVGVQDQANILRAVTGPAGAFADAMTYDPDGSMITRLRDKNTADQRVQTLETYSYDAFNLIERFTKRKDAEPIAGGEGCLPDAATAPLDDFRYRFGPLQEREQKRQYSTSQNQAIAGLMWNYTLLGADAKQLASYNGVQGGFCGQVANTVWIWPVEYNSYGPAQTRIITRPQGAKEFVITDHLGSTRLTLNQTGDILERLDYQPFGKEINEAGEGARTSYIGREKDTESDLGFHGVRMYEPEYGRFMSVDPLWGKYAQMQPYQYAGNSPIVAFDDGGDTVKFLSPKGEKQYNEAKAYLISKAPEAAEYFSAIENDAAHFWLATNSHEQNEVEEHFGNGMMSTKEQERNTIHWDPGAALEFKSEGSISPAMILFHEVVHGAGMVKGERESNVPDGSKTTNPEEKRTLAIENKIAKKIGEGVRSYHSLKVAKEDGMGTGYGKTKRVKNPTKGGRPGSVTKMSPKVEESR